MKSGAAKKQARVKSTPPQIPDHEVIRCIGAGSFGQVWLAKNVVGTHRAVKIVHRNRFTDARPFEREFAGMRRFEPISRTHPGFVAILQIGRNEAEGYFYYVMEAADDVVSGQIIRARNYKARTLSRDLEGGKRLPLGECLQLGLSLTTALDNLHQHGLVHRDIKPSNIIFLKDVPKLADIGLVTDITADTGREGGTQFYAPPEGPGTRSADLYSLAKGLYESCTGKHCRHFPEWPTDLEPLKGGSQLRLFNEILLRACENNPDNRYQSARELYADLWRCSQGVGKAKVPKSSAQPAHVSEQRRPIEHERKLLTVLFVNLFMIESADPEDAQRFMQRGLELIRPVVQSYEGTITQIINDGAMAIFGAPVASEDHAQRAVHAAFAVKRALEGSRADIRKLFHSDFEWRISLNSGLVVAGATDEGQYGARGETVNVASRLLGLAEPGQIIATEETHRAVKDYFFTRSVGEKIVQGKPRPVNLYELTGTQAPQNRLEASAAAGLTPFVGRAKELALLNERLDQIKSGRGQVVLLAGEPGVGKSRLLLEFRRSSRSERVSWLTGRALSFGHEIAYLPIIDLLKNLFEIEETDDESTVDRRLEQGLKALGEEVRFGLPFVKYLLGIGAQTQSIAEMEAQQRRLMIFEVLRKLVLKKAQQGPVIVVIDDLHWVDNTSEDFLVSLAQSLSMSPVLLLLTYRPSYRNPFPELSYVDRVTLQHLSDNESADLARNILAGAELPLELRRLITDKGEGNPFFVEEMIKSLLERGALRRENGEYRAGKTLPRMEVPETIHDVIMSRIDHLEASAKRALQLAAVIGREFSVRLLETIADLDEPLTASLKRLKGLELIYERSLFPEHTCIFKHALTQEVAYNSLLLERRKELHCLVAAAIEELYASRLPDFYGLLAYHYEKGEEWDRALDCLVRASESSDRVGAYREVAPLLSRAMAIAERLGKAGLVTELRGRRGGAWVKVGMWVEAKPDLETALAELPPGQSERRAELLSDLAGACFWKLDVAASHRYASEGCAVAQKVGRKDLTANLEAWLAATEQCAGNLRLASKLFERAVARGAGCCSAPLAMYPLHLYFLGHIDQAVACGREAVRMYQALSDNFAATFGQPHFGLALAAQGHYREAIEVFEQARKLGHKYEVWPFHARSIAMSAGFHLDVFDFKGNEALALEAREKARSADFKPSVVSAGVDLLFNFIQRDDLAKAQQLLGQTSGEAEQTGGWHRWLWELRLTQARADLALGRKRWREALRHAQDSIAESCEYGRLKYQVAGLTTQAKALAGLGQKKKAISDLRKAVRLSRRVGDPAMLLRSCTALLEIEGSDAVLAEAKKTAQRISQELPDDLRRCFEAAEPVRRLGDFGVA